MDPRRRQELTRYGAPAAFLAAVTIAAILVKAGLNGSSSTTVSTVSSRAQTTTASTSTTKLVLTAPQGSTTGTTTAATDTTTPGAVYYVVQSGDTLGSIAQKYNTTVEQLMTLNPGVDPTALTVGQRIRVK
jgi:LysM repeat protein